MNIKPACPHILFIGKQRTGKDLLILHDVYELYTTGKSIFHYFLMKENLDQYDKPLTIYANCKLDKSIFEDFVYIENIEDVKKAHDGILWIHDADLWFDSRSIFDKSLTKKETVGQLLNLVNNMGKNRLQGRFSCHRRNSLDVKLRELMNLKVLPMMYCKSKERKNFKNWFIKYSVYNEWDEKIGQNVLNDPWKKANYYNTHEKVKEIIYSM